MAAKKKTLEKPRKLPSIDKPDRKKKKEELLKDIAGLRRQAARLKKINKACLAQRESEEWFKGIFDSASDGIVIYKIRDDGPPVIINANKAACEMNGLSKEELTGKPVTLMGDVKNREQAMERIKQLQSGRNQTFEAAVNRPDGSIIYAEISARPMTVGRKKYILSVARDITGRKAAEHALRESESRFRGAFENAAVGASVVDLQGRFVQVNRRLCEMLGYRVEELVGKTFSDVTHPDDVKIGLDYMRRMVAGELEFASFEKRYIRKDGEILYLIVSPAIIKDGDGKPQYFLGLFQDVTERKVAEEKIRASLKEKEVLLREVHHRVKNNMSIISALLHLQARHYPDSGLAKIVKESQDRINSMALVHEKLYQTHDFSSISIKSYCKDLIRHVLHSYKSGREEIDLRTSIGEISFPIDVLVPFGLILNELITNSVKYAFEGVERPAIEISLGADGGEARFAFYDNGVGIPPHVSFPNTDSLGLQIINMLVMQLGGAVELDRSAGTKFIISFPYQEK